MILTTGGAKEFWNAYKQAFPEFDDESHKQLCYQAYMHGFSECFDDLDETINKIPNIVSEIPEELEGEFFENLEIERCDNHWYVEYVELGIKIRNKSLLQALLKMYDYMYEHYPDKLNKHETD